MQQNNTRNTKTLVLCSILIAISLITNNLLKFHMPYGGSITLCSMLFVGLCGYFSGPKYGFMSGFAFGILNALIGGFSGLHWMSLILDYLLAFMAFGVTGFFRNKKSGLFIGYSLGVLGRFISSFLSGWLLFGSYAPEGQAPWLYSLLYQISYIVPEYALTMIILAIPMVHNTLYKLKST